MPLIGGSHCGYSVDPSRFGLLRGDAEGAQERSVHALHPQVDSEDQHRLTQRGGNDTGGPGLLRPPPR